MQSRPTHCGGRAHLRRVYANDLVSQVDFASEKLIVDTITDAYPGDSTFAEEGSDIAGVSGWHWLIDPLDGTLNYLPGAGWSASIALQYQQQTVLAIVHDPAVRETFSAMIGRGARLNVRTMRVRPATVLAGSIVGLSYIPSLATKRRLGPILAELCPITDDIRRIPCALGLSHLADGRFDGSPILNTKPWDIAASEMIAREAGAMLSSPSAAINEMSVLPGAAFSPNWSRRYRQGLDYLMTSSTSDLGI